jgi:alkylation response protein AidB-like acyl-CoA dehydrogenase
MSIEAEEVATAVDAIAEAWRADRRDRQARRHLERSDFDALREAGLLTLGIPASSGGAWHGFEASIRGLCNVYRRLAGGDPSVALVSSMHPSVISYWTVNADPSQPDWEAQREAVFASAMAGEQWGTITSEPGSGGDIFRTKSTASPAETSPAESTSPLVGAGYTVTGDKHFGSGMGITDRMVTTAIPDGESDPTVFVLDVRDKPWDGTAGLTLIAEWDGMGMRATQSHAMRLEQASAVRMAWNGKIEEITRLAGPVISTIFTAVVLGVLDEAVESARQQVRARATQLRPYEQVEWARAEQDHWLAVQAFEGALRALECGVPGVAAHAAPRAKQSVAEIAEQTLQRLTRVLGGGTFSQRSPFAHWFEDVRALGFLRPPWGLAYDTLFATSLEPPLG